MACVQIRVIVDTGPETDERERVEGTAQLRKLLLQQGVEEVRLQRDGDQPPGAKAGDGIVLGAMLVTLAPHAFSAVVSVIQAWSARASGRSVEIVEGERSLTASGLSEQEQRELIDDFRRRTAAPRNGETTHGSP
ncbi:hypothetical protein OG883_45330 [Streptomyces sp. NBC_01142]|uniref:hypothetical protein n=1 Tax=Streptomyces sp. NBC_01142 TaxID=2975865 RepID=UPI00225BEDF6|nr:hypothetical protein [Streptomyces sp. NBC_01142]MCX4826863.1 hypothetical protein [Streptomyces sp. NBC_01142]